MEAVDLDVLCACADWRAEGHSVLLVTVMRTWGSSPRPAGAMMALRDDGRVAGSVSGGCIEDDLIERARAGLQALAPGGRPAIETYGIRAEEAHRFGLPCGGTLQLVLEPLGEASAVEPLVERLQRRELVRRTLDLRDGRVHLGSARPDEGFGFDEARVVNVLGARFRLLVIGAGQLSRYLCQTAVGLGFEVIVCDPRESYASDWEPVAGVTLVRSMPDDAVLAMQPDERSAVVGLTHDPKLDDLALMDALRTPAFYVGALGSRANDAKRRERLREHFGLGDAELARLHGPAGIYIGSRTPPEIALSILAEIVATKNGVAVPTAQTVGPAKEARATG